MLHAIEITPKTRIVHPGVREGCLCCPAQAALERFLAWGELMKRRLLTLTITPDIGGFPADAIAQLAAPKRSYKAVTQAESGLQIERRDYV
jgi:hypothetical protein